MSRNRRICADLLRSERSSVGLTCKWPSAESLHLQIYPFACTMMCRKLTLAGLSFENCSGIRNSGTRPAETYTNKNYMGLGTEIYRQPALHFQCISCSKIATDPCANSPSGIRLSHERLSLKRHHVPLNKRRLTGTEGRTQKRQWAALRRRKAYIWLGASLSWIQYPTRILE